MSEKVNITITQAAIAHIQTVMARHPSSVGFRLSMKKYGCNGFGYVPDVVDTKPEGDLELKICDQFRFFVDSKFAQGLNNTEIDFVDKGLGQRQLVFRNPNVEGECGCGESVNFKDQDNG